MNFFIPTMWLKFLSVCKVQNLVTNVSIAKLFWIKSNNLNYLLRYTSKLLKLIKWEYNTYTNLL